MFRKHNTSNKFQLISIRCTSGFPFSKLTKTFPITEPKFCLLITNKVVYFTNSVICERAPKVSFLSCIFGPQFKYMSNWITQKALVTTVNKHKQGQIPYRPVPLIANLRPRQDRFFIKHPLSIHSSLPSLSPSPVSISLPPSLCIPSITATVYDGSAWTPGLGFD